MYSSRYNTNTLKPTPRTARPGTIGDAYLSNIVTWCKAGKPECFVPFMNTDELRWVYEYLCNDVVVPIPMELVKRIQY